MKLMIIALDMLVALPIVTAAFALLLSSVSGSQAYLPALGSSEAARLNAIVTSQQIIDRVIVSANYSSAEQAAQDIASAYNVTAQLSSVGSAAQCGSRNSVCRLATVSGTAYLLVISYENPV